MSGRPANGLPDAAGVAGLAPLSAPDWQEKLAAAVRFIRERDDFLVVSHVQPDGDAIGSTVAVGWLLERLGKTHVLYNDGPVPSRLGFLPGSERIRTLQNGRPARTFRHVICVDCADYARVGEARELIAADAELLNIDHHSTNDGYGSVALLRSEAAATAEILYELLEAFGAAWDADVATAVYTGLLTDTGGFRYANTSPQAMATASALLGRGVNGPELAEALLERMSVEQMKMLQAVIPRLTFAAEGRIAWLWVTEEDMSATGASNEDLEGLVNYPRNVEGVEVGLLFKQHGPAAVKVSLRSAGRVNVAEIARGFGGGGHVRAAGCRIDAALPDAIRDITAAVRKALEAE